MIITFNTTQLAEYGVENMLSGDVIYVTDTEEVYFKTNNIEGGAPKVYRASISGSPVEVVTPVITFDCNYIYSGKTREVTISLDVNNVTDKTKLKNMTLSYGSTSIDIASVPCTKTISVGDTTEFTFAGKYDKTAFSTKKSVTKVCPIYIGVVPSTTSTKEEIVSLIKDDAHLISPLTPLATINGVKKELTYATDDKLAVICGEANVKTKDINAFLYDYFEINAQTTPIESLTGYVYLTSPIMAMTRTNLFEVKNG